MGTLAQRKTAVILGALVADAAAQPLHWNYDTGKLDKLLENAKEVAFWEPSANPFYCIPTGKQSCYGDQSYVILKSLVENKGLDIKSINKSTYDFFGADSDYENKVNEGYKEKSEVVKKEYPIKSAWRHASIKSFRKNYEEGKEETGIVDDQMDGVLRLVSVVALYAGRPEMLEKVEEVVTVTQNSDTSISVCLAAARILEYYILHGKSSDALEKVLEQMADPKRSNPNDLDKGLIGMLREVLGAKSEDHKSFARRVKIS